MILYEKGTTDFTKNGLGYLNNILNASVTEELNGEYSLVFDYPLNENLSNELIEERIIKCKVSNGTQQCFIIKKVVKTYEKMTVTCSHLFYLLLTDLAEDIYPQNLSPKPFLDWILARANYQLPFTTTSDVSIQRTGRYVRRNLVDVILGEQKNSMVNLFGIEIERNNWNIGLKARVGADRGEKLIYGKNITGINLTIDTNEMYTRIMPIGFDGLLLPEKYVDADNIEDYPYPKIGIFEFGDIKYDPEDPDAYHDIEDAYDALREAVDKLYENGVNEPKINIKVDWLELSKTEEYKQYSTLERVELGDTIYAEIFGLNYVTRVIKTVYNPLTDKIEKFEIGSFQPSYATQMNKYEFDLQTLNPTSILEQAQSNATSLITQAMGGYVYKTNNELYIMDNEDPNQAVHVWRWNINGLGYSSTGINGTYGLAMTMDGQIVADFITTGTLRTSVIQGYDSLTTQVSNNTGQISVLTQNVGELNSKIQDIADITTVAESEYATVNLLNVNESQPIMIKIHPMNNVNISYLYPRNNLYPSDTLFMPIRTLRFTNTTTSEIFDYELFDDLLYYDSEHYDEFYWDYDNQTIQITKRCEYAADGSVVLKSSEVIETQTFPSPEDFYLTNGDYTVSLLTYSNAYLMVRCMASNIYTSQFATHSELSQTASNIRTEVEATYATINEAQRLDSKIDQTATNITSTVSQTYETKANASTNYTTLDSKIDQTATSITSTVAETYETKSNANSSYNTIYSTINQTADSINTEVAKKVGETEVISKINQSAEAISIDASKVNISGVITAINNDSSTTINGSKITTGTITANQVNSSIITTSNFSAQNINANNITSGTLKSRAINNGNGTFSVTTGGYLTAASGKVGGWTLNSSGLSYSSGGYTTSLNQQYVAAAIPGDSAETRTWWSIVNNYPSDIKTKNDVEKINNKYEKFYDDLNPVSFKYKKEYEDRKENSTHFGFVAQDVEKSINKNNIDDLALIYGNKLLKINREEIIALNTWQIQELKKQIKLQQQEIETLKKEMEELRNAKN